MNRPICETLHISKMIKYMYIKFSIWPTKNITRVMVRLVNFFTTRSETAVVILTCIYFQIASCLLEHDANVDLGDAVNFSPLHIACNFGHDKVSGIFL